MSSPTPSDETNNNSITVNARSTDNTPQNTISPTAVRSPLLRRHDTLKRNHTIRLSRQQASSLLDNVETVDFTEDTHYNPTRQFDLNLDVSEFHNSLSSDVVTMSDVIDSGIRPEYVYGTKPITHVFDPDALAALDMNNAAGSSSTRARSGSVAGGSSVLEHDARFLNSCLMEMQAAFGHDFMALGSGLAPEQHIYPPDTKNLDGLAAPAGPAAALPSPQVGPAGGSPTLAPTPAPAAAPPKDSQDFLLSESEQRKKHIISLVELKYLDSVWPAFTRFLVCIVIGCATAVLAYVIDVIYHSLYDVILNILDYFLSFNGGVNSYYNFDISWILVALAVATPLAMLYGAVAVAASFFGGYYPVRGSGLPHLAAYLDGSYNTKVPIFTFRVLFSKTVAMAFVLAAGIKAGLQGPMIHMGAVIGKQSMRLLLDCLSSSIFAKMLSCFCCCLIDKRQRCRTKHCSTAGNYTRETCKGYGVRCSRGCNKCCFKLAAVLRLRSAQQPTAGLELQGGGAEDRYSLPSYGRMDDVEGDGSGGDRHRRGSVAHHDPFAAVHSRDYTNNDFAPMPEAGNPYHQQYDTASPTPAGMTVITPITTHQHQHQHQHGLPVAGPGSMIILPPGAHPVHYAPHQHQQHHLLGTNEAPAPAPAPTDGSSSGSESEHPRLTPLPLPMPSLPQDPHPQPSAAPLISGAHVELEFAARLEAYRAAHVPVDLRAADEVAPLLPRGGAHCPVQDNHRIAGFPNLGACGSPRAVDFTDEDADAYYSSLALLDPSAAAPAHAANATDAHAAPAPAAAPATASEVEHLAASYRLTVPKQLQLITRALTNPKDEHDFIACGAAAGFTCAFNAPLAAMILVQSMIRQSNSLQLTIRMFFCTLVAVLVTNLLDAEQSILPDRGFIDTDIPGIQAMTAHELYICVGMGLVGGFIGYLFTQVNITFQRLRVAILRTKFLTNIHFVLLVSLVVIVPGVFLSALTPCTPIADNSFPVCADHPTRCLRASCPPGHFSEIGTLFFNYPQNVVRLLWDRQDSGNEFNFINLFIFAPIYFLLTCLSYMAAVPGGFFTPAIILGGIYGRLVARTCMWAFNMSLNTGVYAALGSVTMLTAINRLTLPMAVMMVEFTSDVQFLMPIMVVIICAKFVADSLIGGFEGEEMKLTQTYLSMGEKANVALTDATALDVLLASGAHSRFTNETNAAAIQEALGAGAGVAGDGSPVSRARSVSVSRVRRESVSGHPSAATPDAGPAASPLTSMFIPPEDAAGSADAPCDDTTAPAAAGSLPRATSTAHFLGASVAPALPGHALGVTAAHGHVHPHAAPHVLRALFARTHPYTNLYFAGAHTQTPHPPALAQLLSSHYAAMGGGLNRYALVDPYVSAVYPEWHDGIALHNVACLGEVDTLARIKAILECTSQVMFPVVSVLPHPQPHVLQALAQTVLAAAPPPPVAPSAAGAGVFLGLISRANLQLLLDKSMDYERVVDNFNALSHTVNAAQHNKPARGDAATDVHATITRRLRRRLQGHLRALRALDPAMDPKAVTRERLLASPFVRYSSALHAMGHAPLTKPRELFVMAVLYRVIAAEHAATQAHTQDEHKADTMPTRTTLTPLRRAALAAKAITSLVRLPAPSRAVLDRLLEAAAHAAHADIESNLTPPPSPPLRRLSLSGSDEEAPSTVREVVQRLSKYFEDSVEAHNRKAQTRALSSSAHSHSARYDAHAGADADHANAADDTISAHTAAGAAAAEPLAAAARARNNTPRASATYTPQWVNVASLCRRDAAIAHLHTPAFKLWQWFRNIGMKRVVLLDASHRPVGIVTRKSMILGERNIVGMVQKEAAATL